MAAGRGLSSRSAPVARLRRASASDRRSLGLLAVEEVEWGRPLLGPLALRLPLLTGTAAPPLEEESIRRRKGAVRDCDEGTSPTVVNARRKGWAGGMLDTAGEKDDAAVEDEAVIFGL